MSVTPTIPPALFSCALDTEYTWPARDLHWVTSVQGFVCPLCLDADPTLEPGFSLAEFIIDTHKMLWEVMGERDIS